MPPDSFSSLVNLNTAKIFTSDKHSQNSERHNIPKGQSILNSKLNRENYAGEISRRIVLAFEERNVSNFIWHFSWIKIRKYRIIFKFASVFEWNISITCLRVDSEAIRALNTTARFLWKRITTLNIEAKSENSRSHESSANLRNEGRIETYCIIELWNLVKIRRSQNDLCSEELLMVFLRGFEDKRKFFSIVEIKRWFVINGF